jgi:hypothetical protein
MSNELAPLPFAEMQALALSIAKSGMFGIRTPDQAMVLMSIAQAEGRHPALAARDYHIINNSPSKKSEAMLRDFLGAGGRVQWRELSDQAAEATFSHPQGGEATIRWDAARVAQAGLSNPMHKKFPRQMLRSRVVSEGVRTIWPMATGGMYAPEEAAEIRAEPIDVTPPAAPVDTAADLDAFATQPPVDQTEIDGVLTEAVAKAALGTEAFRGFWVLLNHRGRELLRPNLSTYQAVAATADATRLVDEERARDEDPFGLPPLPSAATAAPAGSGKDATSTGDFRGPSDTGDVEAPAVPLAAAVRALTPVAGDDGEPNWRAWSEAFVALIERASPADCEKLRISSLPAYGRCRSEYGDGARAIVDALTLRTKAAIGNDTP